MSTNTVNARQMVKWAAWAIVVALVAYLAYVNIFWSDVGEPPPSAFR
jgi:hypothetical protein